MTQTVLSNFFNQNLQATAGFGNNETKRRFFLTLLVAFVAYAGMAQTYTTKQAGNWNSTSTWVGGTKPTGTIGAGVVVNIKHAVNFDLDADLSITGTLNIEGDSLKFPSAYGKKVLIASAGTLYVKNGGLIQDVYAKKSDAEISGRVTAENARLTFSKGVIAKAGAKRTYRNSTVLVNEKYTIEGTSALRTLDSLINTTLEVAIEAGDMDIKDYVTFNVDNAKVIVTNGFLKNAANSIIKVLPGAAGNYGFKQLKTDTHLENNGTWDARIDAFCVNGDVKGSKDAEIDFTRPEDCSVQNGAPAPELSFVNPVLKSGTANKEGAVYRFSNITTGVDAEIKLKKFSRNDIVMKNFDNSALGWNKAFQPEFGLPGVVQPNQNWYIDFEMTFFEAGTNKKKKVQKADFTALDVDGDGYSISEYAMFSNPANVSYSPVSSLAALPAGSLGAAITCATCNVSSILVQCLVCQGKGEVLDIPCVACSGHGTKHQGCNHPYEGMIGNILQGPVQNFNNIDTAGTAVMAT